MPLAYSIILFVLAVFFIITEVRKGTAKIHWRKLLERPAVEGLVFFLLSMALFVLMYFLGTAIALVIFSISSLLFMKRLSVAKTIIFSIVWVGAIYILFVTLLGVPFESGVIFGLMR